MAEPAIGSREWLEARNPGIFDASRDYTSQQTQDQFRSRPASQSSGVRSQDGFTPVLTGGGHVNWVQNNGTDYGSGSPYPDRTTTNNNGGGGRGRGGGGGPAPVNWSMLGKVWGNKPKQQTWEGLDFKAYEATPYREFNTAQYDTMRQGLTDAIAGDRAAGNAQYDQLGQEMAAYRNPWANPTPQTTNPAMPNAMARMMAANNVDQNINQADTNRGVQADQGFGNLLAVLGQAAQQEQGSRMRSNAGYQRNMNERLDAEQRGGTLGVNMAETKARELYEREKWEFGESIAQMNYQSRMQNAQYNNQGQNAVNAQNVQGHNEFYANREGALLDFIAGGRPPTELAIAQAFNLDPGLKDAMAALVASGETA